MPRSNKPNNTPVILTDTWAHGTVTTRNPNGTYKIRVKGRPARLAQPDKRGRGPIPSREKAPDFDRDDVLEDVVALGMTPAEKAAADGFMRTMGIRGQHTPAQRFQLRIRCEDDVDDDNSSDHKISEAQRFLDALDQVEQEDG